MKNPKIKAKRNIMKCLINRRPAPVYVKGVDFYPASSSIKVSNMITNNGYWNTIDHTTLKNMGKASLCTFAWNVELNGCKLYLASYPLSGLSSIRYVINIWLYLILSDCCMPCTEHNLGRGRGKLKPRFDILSHYYVGTYIAMYTSTHVLNIIKDKEYLYCP